MKKHPTKDETAEYKFEDAYDIVGYGVGRLNLERAATSEAFKKKAKELAIKIEKHFDHIQSENINEPKEP